MCHCWLKPLYTTPLCPAGSGRGETDPSIKCKLRHTLDGQKAKKGPIFFSWYALIIQS